MISYPGGVEDTEIPTLHLLIYGPDEHGMYRVERHWGGLSFAGIVLLGAEAAMTNMNESELTAFLDAFQSNGLGKKIPVVVKRK